MVAVEECVKCPRYRYHVPISQCWSCSLHGVITTTDVECHYMEMMKSPTRQIMDNRKRKTKIQEDSKGNV